jgi:carbohydrate-selective porin OprB
LTLVLLTYSSLNFAQVAESLPPESSNLGVMSRVFSKPRDLLREANGQGISFHGTFVYDWTKEMENGADSGAGFGRDSFDFFMPINGMKVFGLAGSSGLVRLKYHENDFGQTFDGAAQIYSNIDAPSRTTLYEIWFEQILFSEKLRLKAGKIDANTEFAAVQSAGDFLNSSMGFSPTIVEFPTYPEPKLAINAFLHLRPNYRLGFGVFQTASKGMLSIIEPNHTWNLGQSEHSGRASFGYWRLDGTMARLNGTLATGTQGFYTVVEQSMWHQALGQDEHRLLAFFQAGWAEAQISPFTNHCGGGIVLQGPFRRRIHDSIGTAATWVHLSAQPGTGGRLSGELAIEAYYKAVISQHFALVQDLQYLHEPGGMSAKRDCTLVTPRLVVSF